MMTTTLRRVEFPSIPYWLLILLALALMAGAFLFNSLAHANFKHPGDQDKVRQCLEEGGAAWMGFNPKLNRYAFICKLKDGRVGFRALGIDQNGQWYQATSFIRETAQTTGDVISYLQDTGYARCSTGISQFSITGAPAEIYSSLIKAGIITP